MIIPTLWIKVFKNAGTDVYAQPVYAPPFSEKVCPVKLNFQQRATSVRTDAAGSKSRAAESNAQVTILALPGSKIELDDKLEIMGYSLRVVDVHPRYTVTGKLDHLEVKCDAWV